MVRVATADDPDVLCVQEVPAWALGRFTVGDVAARPVVGPLRIPSWLGRALTAPNHGLLRSAFAGQGNAIRLAARLELLDHDILELNPRAFRVEQAAVLGLDTREVAAWGGERRIVQVVRLRRPDGRTATLANMHCTSSDDDRLPDAELLRAARFAVSSARGDEPVILAGDFNVRPGRSRTLDELAGPDWGFSPPGDGIDHVLVRGVPASPPTRWPDGRRRHGGRLLSDHAPVEREVE